SKALKKTAAQLALHSAHRFCMLARVGSAGRRRVLASRYAALAVLWPLFSVLVLAALILLCWITAVAGGKCDREQGGHVETAYVTEISLTTETPPQSYVWTLGVAVTWICFLCPATWLLHEAFLWTLRRHWAEALVLALSELLLVVAMLFLVGLAAVTNRGTFLEPSFELEDGHAIHQRMADLFFMCFYIHGGVFLVLQGIHWKELIWLERRSLVIKALLMVFMSLSVAGVLPSLFLELPALSPTEEIRELNRRGIMLYVGTYSLELAALRKRLKEEGKSQAVASELRGSED
ncbi:unnamed protein product, partial [Effrenium voratum]